MNEINKLDITEFNPEFGYHVHYFTEDSKTIDWEVLEGDEVLMKGVFKSDDFYRSEFNIIPNKLEENVFETLFYVYFEYIKLKCIDIVEFREPLENTELEEEV
jgi:hypothetical protein